MSSLKDLASLIMVPSLYKDGELHTVKPLADENIIVHPDATEKNDGVDGTTPSTSSNFTFSRGSNLAATRVDVNGLIEKGRENILLQSNAFDNAVWDNQLGGSVTGGQTGYDGTNDAWLLNKSATSYRHIRQLNLSASGVYNYSIYAKANTLDQITIFNDVSGTNPYARFSLVDGSIVASSGLIDSSAVDVGNGWWRLSATFNDTITTARIYPDFGQTNAGSIYIQDAQLEQGLVATDYIETGTSAAQSGILEDMPRLDYSGGASCPSLLLEPQRSNLIPQSEYIEDSGWTKINATITTNHATSPEGVQNASLITFASGGYIVESVSTTKTIGSTETISVFSNADISGTFLKYGGGTAAGTDVEGREVIGNGWYRYYVTRTFTEAETASTQLLIAQSNVGNSVLIYGAQLEQGSYPTSYIPTYGTSQTRSFDNAGTRTDMQDFLGTDTGAWFMHLDEFYFDITGTGLGAIILAENGQQATSIELVQDGNFQYKITLNNSTAVENLDGEDKLLMNWSSEFFKIFVNGVNVYSSSSSKWSNAFTHLILPQTTRAPHIKIKQMLFFPTALTDSECIALTTL